MTAARLRLSALTLPFLVAASVLRADPVTVQEVVLSAPTSWCPADAGRPVIVEMRGLPVHGVPPPAEGSQEVRIRRGVENVATADVRPVPLDEIRTRSGDRTRVSRDFSPEPRASRADEIVPLGILNAEGQACLRGTGTRYLDIHWRIETAEGRVVASGVEPPEPPPVTNGWWSQTRIIHERPYRPGPSSGPYLSPDSFRLGGAAFFIMEQHAAQFSVEGFPDADR